MAPLSGHCPPLSQPSERRTDSGLSGHLALGASVTIAATLGTRVMGIASIAVLGRLLDPHDFGVMAIALIFVGLSEAIMSRQFDLACIRTQDINDSHYNTNFTLSAIWGLFAGAVLYILATPIAVMMHAPDTADVLRLLAVVPVLDGMRNPHFVGFERNLNFIPDIGTNFAAKAAQTAAVILLALIWGNYWAMAWALIIFTATRTGLTHILRPTSIRPTLIHWREFVAFGGWLSGTGIMRFVMARTDTAMISAKLGTATVGLYNLGFELTQMATNYLAVPLMRIIYPGLSSMSKDRARLRAAYYKAQSVLLAILLPIGVGIALVAHEAVLIFVGAKWLGAVPVLWIMLPVSAVAVLVYNVQAVIMVDGNTRAMFLRNAIVAIIQIPAIWFGLVWFGFVGAVSARACAILIHLFITLIIAGQATGDPWHKTLTEGSRSFAAVILMAVTVLGLSMFLPESTTIVETIGGLVLKISVGLVVYISAHAGIWLASGRPDGVETFAWSFARRILNRQRSGKNET